MSSSYYIFAKKAIISLLMVSVLVSPSLALARVPTDPSYGNQAPMYEQIHAPEAWDVTIGSKSVTVAVIDTGADTWHEDISQNVWTNPYEIPGNNIDDDFNGYVDDIHGWNFVDDNNDPRTSIFDDVVDPEAVRHGTIVAGLLGAVGNNGRNGVGMSWNVQIMPLKAIDSTGGGSFYNVARAVDYAVANGADVISMSFVGGEANEGLRRSLENAHKKDIVVVAAAGNHDPDDQGYLQDSPRYPVCYDVDQFENWIIGVSAVTNNDKLATFANYGNCVDIAAPGENLYSTERYAPQYGYTKEFGGGWDGTSFAAPLVAGTAALIKAIHPEWRAKRIIDTILSTADSLASKNPDNYRDLGYGRLNAGRALAAAAADLLPKAPLGATYYFKGTDIRRYNFDTNQTELVTKIPGATVLSVTTVPGTGLYKRQVIALIKRGNYYYVRTLRDSGELLREFALPTKTFNNKRITPSSVKFLMGDGYEAGEFVVLGRDASKKQTVFTGFTMGGKVTREMRLAQTVLAWDASRLSNRITYATQSGSKVVLTSVDWQSRVKNSYTISNVQKLEAMKIGPVWNNREEQAVVVYQTGGEVRRLVVDPVTQGSGEVSLGTLANKSQWFVFISPTEWDDGSVLVQFQKTGGYYRVVSGRDDLIRRVLLPKFDGTFE